MHKHVGKHYQSHSKGMTKYKLAKNKSDEFGGYTREVKIVTKKSELNKCTDNGWYEIDRFTPIITPIKKWIKSLNRTEEITLFGIIFTGFLTFSLWGLSEYFQYKNSNLKTESSLLIKRFDSLKKSHYSLNQNFELLNQHFHSLADSLSQKNKIIVDLKLEIKSKKTSDEK